MYLDRFRSHYFRRKTMEREEMLKCDINYTVISKDLSAFLFSKYRGNFFTRKNYIAKVDQVLPSSVLTLMLGL